MAPHLQSDMCFVMLMPWCASAPKPDNVINPDTENEAAWNEEEVQARMRQSQLLLVVCVFETKFEQALLKRLLDKLDENDEQHVFAVQLHEVPNETSSEYMQVLMARHDAILKFGVQAVIMNPAQDPVRLRRMIELESTWFQAQAARANQMLQEEGPSQDEMEALLKRHHGIMWEAVPKALMPLFPPVNKELLERKDMVGIYKLLSRYKAANADVLLGKNAENDQQVVVKAVDKSKRLMTVDLEQIYREFRFLSERLRHPHIIRLLDFLHSPTRVYFVYEFGGMANLRQALENQPGYRLEDLDVLECIAQVRSALVFCHAQKIAHRDVCLEHVAFQEDSSGLRCKLLNFKSSVLLQSDETTSMYECGCFPFMAPEVALGEPYKPIPADCWSFGMVVLETAGGLGSLNRAVGFEDDEEVDINTAYMQINEFFSSPGSRARALQIMGGVRSPQVLTMLEDLLQPVPEHRKPLGDQSQQEDNTT
jgi:hypothetical protein